MNTSIQHNPMSVINNLLYKSRFLSVVYHPDKSLIESTWTLDSVELSPDQLKEEMLERMHGIEKHRPKYVLTNSKLFFYRLPPVIQTWMSEEILKRYYEAGVEKMAFVISDDLVSQISIEQAIQESEDTAYKIRYFDTVEEAKEWLKG